MQYVSPWFIDMTEIFNCQQRSRKRRVSSAVDHDDYTDIDVDDDRRSTATGASGYRGEHIFLT